MTKKSKKSLEALRDETRSLGQQARSPEDAERDRAERLGFLEYNKPEALALAKGSPREDVVVIANAHDPLGRTWAKHFGGLSDAEIDQGKAANALANRALTAALMVDRAEAIERLALTSPGISETLEGSPVGAGRVILVISAEGVLIWIEPWSAT